MRKMAQSSRLLVLIAGLVAVIAAPTAGRAQSTDYPSQRISIVVGFAVGGFADTIGRWIATRLGERLGQTVVVQNMEGGGGIRAARRVATSPPDGYTLLVTTTSLAINETLVTNRGYTAGALDAISLPVSAPEFAVSQREIAGQVPGRLGQRGKSRDGLHGIRRHRFGIAHRRRILLQGGGEGAGEAHSVSGRQSGDDGSPHRRRDSARRHGDGPGAQCQQRRRDRAWHCGGRTLADAAVRSDIHGSRLSRVCRPHHGLGSSRQPARPKWCL